MKKILLVDNDTSTLEMIMHVLTKRGFNVIAHTSAENVPDVVEECQPSLVLLDVHLPQKFGTKICTELKQKYQDLPLILISTTAQDEVEHYGCQADAFIAKPFDIIELVSTINLHI